MIPKFRAYDTKWKRWIKPEDISYYGGEWYFERRGEDGGDIIETAQLKDGIILEQYIANEDEIEIYEGDKLQEVKRGKVVRDFIAEDIRTFTRQYDRSHHASVFKKIGTIHDKENSK